MIAVPVVALAGSPNDARAQTPFSQSDAASQQPVSRQVERSSRDCDEVLGQYDPDEMVYAVPRGDLLFSNDIAFDDHDPENPSYLVTHDFIFDWITRVNLAGEIEQMYLTPSNPAIGITIGADKIWMASASGVLYHSPITVPDAWTGIGYYASHVGELATMTWDNQFGTLLLYDQNDGGNDFIVQYSQEGEYLGSVELEGITAGYGMVMKPDNKLVIYREGAPKDRMTEISLQDTNEDGVYDAFMEIQTQQIQEVTRGGPSPIMPKGMCYRGDLCQIALLDADSPDDHKIFIMSDGRCCPEYGDFTGDNYVGPEDFAILAECITGPPMIGDLPLEGSCEIVDMNADGAVDMREVQAFQLNYGR